MKKFVWGVSLLISGMTFAQTTTSTTVTRTPIGNVSVQTTTPDWDRMGERLRSEYGLTDEQLARVKEAQTKRWNESRQMREQWKTQRENYRIENERWYGEQMRSIMTPEQYSRWQAKHAEKQMRKQDRQRMKMMDGKPGWNKGHYKNNHRKHGVR